jgi:formylglycine-generating enzyme required for sulfatase activity
MAAYNKHKLIIGLVLSMFYGNLFGQCPLVFGTLSVSDTFSIKATEITVFDYASFIVTNNYDSSLFPNSSVLDTASYKILFDELKNRRHKSFLKIRGKGSFAFCKKHVRGNSSTKKQVKVWLKLPILGVSTYQIEKYCKWLEDYYNQFGKIHKRTCTYEIKIPSEAELQRGLQNKWVKTNKEIDKKFTYRFIVYLHKK